jgi:hypothetical protein
VQGCRKMIGSYRGCRVQDLGYRVQGAGLQEGDWSIPRAREPDRAAWIPPRRHAPLSARRSCGAQGGVLDLGIRA